MIINKKSNIKRIRAEYIDIDNKIKELHIKQRELSEEMKNVLGNIKDKNDCSEIIDFVYQNKVEEIHEYMMRKIYILGEKW